MKLTPIVIEETFDVPVEKVWEALTSKDKMKIWYFDLKAFEPTVGFEFTFPGQGHTGEKYTHLCKVTKVVPNKTLQYSWRYENRPGSSLVTFELFDEGAKTRLRLSHEGIESFPQGDPDFAVESFTGGWTELIRKSLRDYLETVKR